MLFALKFLLIVLWSALMIALGLFLSLIRWGDLNLNRDVGKLLSSPLLRVLGIKIAVEGQGNIPEGPKIFVANHQSGFEVVIFAAFCPDRTVFIGKKEIAWIPLLGLYFVAAGNIFIDRSRRTKAMATLTKVARTIRGRNASVMVFPEGTRNRTNELLLPFKRGPFYLALEAQVPIVPVVVSRFDDVFNWRKKVLRPGVIHIQVLPPIPTHDRDPERGAELAAYVRASMISAMAAPKKQV